MLRLSLPGWTASKRTSTYSRRRLRTSDRCGSGSSPARSEVVPIALASSMTKPLRTSKREAASPNVNASRNASKASVAATISPTGGRSSCSDRRRRYRPRRKPPSTARRTTATVARKTPQIGRRSSGPASCIRLLPYEDSVDDLSSIVREAGMESAVDSLARASRDANVDPPRRHLRVFLLAHEVELGRPDIGMPGELAHLVQRGAVANGVVDGGLAERMDADAPAAQPVRVDAGRLAVFLHEPPGGLAVQVPPLQPGAVRPHRPEQRPLLVVPDVRPLEIPPDRPRRVEQDLPPLLVPLLGDVEIMLDPVGLEVPDAGMNDRRDPAAGDEEDAHEREVADPLQGLGRDRLQERDRLPLGQ